MKIFKDGNPNGALNRAQMKRFLEIFDPNASGAFKMSRIGGRTSDVWESPGGLRYAITEAAKPGQRDFHSINHVLTHGVPNWKTSTHSVFAKTTGTRLEFDKILPLVDEAWTNKAAANLVDIAVDSGDQFYRIPMGRIVGTNGQDHMVIFLKPGSPDVRAAFPCFATYSPN